MKTHAVNLDSELSVKEAGEQTHFKQSASNSKVLGLDSLRNADQDSFRSLEQQQKSQSVPLPQEGVQSVKTTDRVSEVGNGKNMQGLSVENSGGLQKILDTHNDSS